MKLPLSIAVISLGGLLIAGCATTPPPAAPKPAKPAAPVAVAKAPPPAPVAVAEVAVAPAAPVPVSEAAKAVVERLTEPEAGGVPHEVVAATGFPQAMSSLQSGAAAPTVDQPVNYASQPPTRGLTADGASAELVERDWTGVVLVPMNAEFAKAYTAAVRLTSIEAHPLKDGRVRTWMRVRNVANVPVQVGVACRFLMKELPDATLPRFYSLDIPVGGYRDVFFVSPAGTLTNYTVLVKAGS